MTKENFIKKGILMLMVFVLIWWLGQYIFIVDGQVDWFRLTLVYGIPMGIPYMLIIIPGRWGISSMAGGLALSIIIGGLFGSIIAAGLFIRTMVYLIGFPVCRLFSLVRKGCRC